MIGVCGTRILPDLKWYHDFATLVSGCLKTPHGYLQKENKAIKRKSTLNSWSVFQFAYLHF